MKPNPVITELLSLLGGPALFPHLTESQAVEYIEEHVADLLTQIHAAARARALRDFNDADKRAQEAATIAVGTELSAPRTVISNRAAEVPVSVGATGTWLHIGTMDVKAAHVADLCRQANELWYRIPPPKSAVHFLMDLRKTPKKKAPHV